MILTSISTIVVLSGGVQLVRRWAALLSALNRSLPFFSLAFPSQPRLDRVYRRTNMQQAFSSIVSLPLVHASVRNSAA